MEKAPSAGIPEIGSVVALLIRAGRARAGGNHQWAIFRFTRVKRRIAVNGMATIPRIKCGHGHAEEQERNPGVRPDGRTWTPGIPGRTDGRTDGRARRARAPCQFRVTLSLSCQDEDEIGASERRDDAPTQFRGPLSVRLSVQNAKGISILDSSRESARAVEKRQFFSRHSSPPPPPPPIPFSARRILFLSRGHAVNKTPMTL